MGTYTANKELYMPTVGEQGWGTLMNGNLETIDTFLKPITVSGSTYTFTGNQTGGTITATKITNSGTLTNTGKITANGGIGTTTLTASSTSTFTGKITANGGIGTTSLTTSSTITSTGKITANGGIGTKALTATSISNSGNMTNTGTLTCTGKIYANGGINADLSPCFGLTSASGEISAIKITNEFTLASSPTSNNAFSTATDTKTYTCRKNPIYNTVTIVCKATGYSKYSNPNSGDYTGAVKLTINGVEKVNISQTGDGTKTETLVLTLNDGDVIVASASDNGSSSSSSITMSCTGFLTVA